jgi:hypothetical protein
LCASTCRLIPVQMLEDIRVLIDKLVPRIKEMEFA